MLNQFVDTADTLVSYLNTDFDHTMRVDAGTWAFIGEQFARPFELSELKTRKQGPALLVYVDARVYEQRLDTVVGLQNWQLEQSQVTIVESAKIDKTPEDAPRWPTADGSPGKFKNPVISYEPVQYGGIQSKITIFGVSKSDVGNPSMAEQIKGAYSDSLKRAGVVWGIGRYLYEMKNLRGIKEEHLPDFAIPEELPDFATQAALLRSGIAGLLPRYTGENSLVIGKVRELSQYTPNTPLVYQRFAVQKLTELQKIVKDNQAVEEVANG